MIANDQIQPGYKQSDAGVIPEDWDVVEAFSLDPFITSGSRGWAKYYSDRGALFMRITNLSRDCIYPDLTNQKLVALPQSGTEGLRTALQDGDILISITADIGIIGYVNGEIPKPAYINQHIACLRLNPEKANSRFQSYYLASHGPQRHFAEMTDVGAKSGINLTTVGKLKLLRPPLPEQRAIAGALSDADALITKLDALIAKKRDLKQAVMQQLLTGRTRLPVFNNKAGYRETELGAVPEDWEVKPLRSFAQLKNGYAFKSSTYSTHGRFNIITITNVQDGYMDAADCSKTNFLPREIQPHHKLELGDVLISMTGNVGRVCRVTTPNCLLNQRVGKLISTNVDASLLFMLLRQRCFSTAMINKAKGGAQGNIGVSDILDFKFALPTIVAEQAAIAGILSDLDAELAALERKCDKARMLKNAMIQVLMTGRVRMT